MSRVIWLTFIPGDTVACIAAADGQPLGYQLDIKLSKVGIVTETEALPGDFAVRTFFREPIHSGEQLDELVRMIRSSMHGTPTEVLIERDEDQLPLNAEPDGRYDALLMA